MQVDAGVKGISPGPFTEEFLTREQGTLRLLGSLCMAGDTSICVFAMMEWPPLCSSMHLLRIWTSCTAC